MKTTRTGSHNTFHKCRNALKRYDKKYQELLKDDNFKNKGHAELHTEALKAATSYASWFGGSIREFSAVKPQEKNRATNIEFFINKFISSQTGSITSTEELTQEPELPNLTFDDSNKLFKYTTQFFCIPWSSSFKFVSIVDIRRIITKDSSAKKPQGNEKTRKNKTGSETAKSKNNGTANNSTFFTDRTSSFSIDSESSSTRAQNSEQTSQTKRESISKSEQRSHTQAHSNSEISPTASTPKEPEWYSKLKKITFEMKSFTPSMYADKDVNKLTGDYLLTMLGLTDAHKDENQPDAEKIRKAFGDAARANHPDKNQGKAGKYTMDLLKEARDHLLQYFGYKKN